MVYIYPVISFTNKLANLFMYISCSIIYGLFSTQCEFSNISLQKSCVSCPFGVLQSLQYIYHIPKNSNFFLNSRKSLISKTHLVPRVLDKRLWTCNIYFTVLLLSSNEIMCKMPGTKEKPIKCNFYYSVPLLLRVKLRQGLFEVSKSTQHRQS